MTQYRVCVVGSGNWGTTIAKIVAENTAEHKDLFVEQVKMWVFQEKVDGKKLTDIINTEHENVKYLQGIKLPHNLVAEPDIVETVKDANIIVFNIPHQFLGNICKQLKGHVSPKTRALSCLKGLEVSKEGIFLPSEYITRELGIQCGVLSGANLAPEVAREKFSETTIAYVTPKDTFDGDVTPEILTTLFMRKYFHVHFVDDVAGVSIGGALKNVIALGAGFVEGKGWGDNAKAAVMRRGLLDMVKFGTAFFPGCRATTFTEQSSGVADLITSCNGGRNVRVGREYGLHDEEESIFDIEKRLLNGQSAQGVGTAREVHEFLSARGRTHEFPLLEAVYQIVYEHKVIEDLPSILHESTVGDNKL